MANYICVGCVGVGCVGVVQKSGKYNGKPYDNMVLQCVKNRGVTTTPPIVFSVQ